MTSRFALMTVAAFSAGAFAQNAPKIISFEELPRLVREKNEHVQSAESSLKAQEARKGRLLRSFLPSIHVQAGQEEMKIGSDPTVRKDFWKAEASVNIYRGGRDLLENKIRAAAAEAAEIDLKGEYISELREAQFNFWKIIATQRTIEDLKSALQKNESYLKSAKRRAGAGVATGADAVEFELNRTKLNQDLKKLMLEQDLTKNRLSVAVGMDDHENLHIKSDFPHPSEKELEVPKLNPSNQLEVQSLNAQSGIDELRKSKAARWWQPKIDVYSSYGVPSLTADYDRAVRHDNEWSTGIRVGIDLEQGLEDHYESKARKYEAQALRKRADHRRREVIAQDHELREDLKLLHELIHDADKDIEKADRFLKLTESEYSRGVKNGPDLLGALEKTFEFRRRRTELYKEYHQTQSALVELIAALDR